MKILHIIPAYKPAWVYGGPTYSVSLLCEALVRNHHDVTVLTTNANGVTQLDVETGKRHEVDHVSVIYFSRWTKDQSNFSPGLLLKFWRKARQYDVIHIHAWWNMVAIPAVMICRIKGIRPVLSTRGTLSAFSFTHQNAWLKKWFHRLFGRWLLHNLIFHVTSGKEKAELMYLFKKSACVQIPNLISLPQTTYSRDLNATELKVVFMGRIHPVKNIEFLLDVFDRSLGIPFRLDIVGSGDPAYLEELKTQVNHPSAINWSPSLEGAEKWNCLAKADLLVLPSRTENFGNVVMESLSVGTPILISENVGSSAYVIENNLGWVVPARLEDWKKMIRYIHENPGERERIREQAPSLVHSHFGEKALIKRYEDMYRMITDQAGSL